MSYEKLLVIESARLASRIPMHDNVSILLWQQQQQDKELLRGWWTHKTAMMKAVRAFLLLKLLVEL